MEDTPLILNGIGQLRDALQDRTIDFMSKLFSFFCVKRNAGVNRRHYRFPFFAAS